MIYYVFIIHQIRVLDSGLIPLLKWLLLNVLGLELASLQVQTSFSTTGHKGPRSVHFGMIKLSVVSSYYLPISL